MNFERKDFYTMNDFLKIVEILRSPEGCPWDKAQTHESIRANFIEETYEAIEAIDTRDTALLREELGDVLLQVALHAQMEKEQGHFSFENVVNEVAQKLVYRHPHVFGDVSASNEEEALKSWDDAKKASKEQKTTTQVLQSVSRALPALIRSEKVQKKAAKAGFDWPDVQGAMEKVSEELSEVRSAAASGNQEACMDEVGDLLFAAVNVARFLHAEPEEALTRSCDKFIRRFQTVENLASEKGVCMETASLEVLDALWEEAKREERKEQA